ncbi:hypothetical protein BB560_001800 [Smittium megazygosporum]|uniref:RNA helicase n=1 Tax=Smittium megazygosporum TaxID=133381 RepID=A0A2T9ZGL2_9FUNG|nr:hypothetical protein BB560_001800 [Smittium megazygosporum]
MDAFGVKKDFKEPESENPSKRVAVPDEQSQKSLDKDLKEKKQLDHEDSDDINLNHLDKNRKPLQIENEHDNILGDIEEPRNGRLDDGGAENKGRNYKEDRGVKSRDQDFIYKHKTEKGFRERGRDRNRSGERIVNSAAKNERDRKTYRNQNEAQKNTRIAPEGDFLNQISDTTINQLKQDELVSGENKTVKKRVPLSIQDFEMIKKSSQESVKPTFLSKEERQRVAIEKRQKQVSQQRQLEQAEIDSTKQALSILLNQKNNNDKDRDNDRDNGRDRGISRHGYDRVNFREGRSGSKIRGQSRDRSSSRERERQIIREKKLKELEMKAIRERYIGGEKEQRKSRRTRDKNFVFDWDAKEDTSHDFNELYNFRHEPQFFGRGRFAGFDIKEQMARKSQFYRSLLSQRRTKEEEDRIIELENKTRKKEAIEMWDDRHWSEKTLEEMKSRDWRIFKEDFNISYKGGNIPNPIRYWNESTIPKDILDTVKKIGYDHPTPIQRQTIPIGLQNRDLIGIAETGSGKTASFLIPMLAYILELPRIDKASMADGPYAIILAPTRELAQQIEQETLKFSKLLGFKCVSIVGGRSMNEQALALSYGAEIVIATPGRLRDCIDRRILVLNQTTYIVMDEADRMIDMGFEEDVNFILDALPASHLKPDSQDAEDSSKMLKSTSGSDLRYRQTTMFSATMPPLVERLAKKYLRRPAIVTIGTAGQAVETVEQRVEFVQSVDKKKIRLVEVLSDHFKPPMIVFANLKKTTDLLSKLLTDEGYLCVVLHGGKSQEQREAALAKLKSGEADVLVATDVAGRGIDIKDVSLVVNFDMAKSIEGRTGRAGKQGVAITFLTNEDTEVMYDLRKMIEKSSISKCPIELIKHEASQAPPGLVKTKRKFEETVFKD